MLGIYKQGNKLSGNSIESFILFDREAQKSLGILT